MATASRLALLAVLGGCTIDVHHTSAWNYRASWGLVDRTGTEVVELSSPDRADATTLEVAVEGHAGEVSIELTDPDGVVRYRETVRGGERDSELRFAAVPGQWRCSLEFADFDGGYRVRMGAHSEPALRIEATVTDVQIR